MKATTKVPDVTVTEDDKPSLSLQETSGEFSWTGLLQRYWSMLPIEYADRRSNSSFGANAYSGDVSGSATSTRLSYDRSVIELPERIRSPIRQYVSFHPIQEWEGYVTGVSQNLFTARLADITAGGQFAEEEAELPIDDLTDDDRELLAPGRVFRWAIGYQRSAGGTKRRVSQIVFRRLPQWTKGELSDAEQEGRRLSEALRWE